MLVCNIADVAMVISGEVFKVDVTGRARIPATWLWRNTKSLVVES